MDRIELFRIFVRVVESSSFTRAADSLNLPRSTVSSAIQALERRMGTRLLSRTTRRVAPTQDGALFYERCLHLVVEVDDAEQLFRRNGARPAGRIKIDVPGRIGRLVIAPALPTFLDLYPDIECELGVTDRAVNLVEDRVDCALRVGPLADSRLVARHLGDLQLINAASPAYLARHGAPSTPADLAHHWMVRYASPSTGRIESWEWEEHGAVQSLAMRGRVTVNNAEAYIACCLSGLGLIQIPAYDVRSHLEAGELIEVMSRHRAAPLPMTLLYPHRRPYSRRLQVFAEWLQALLTRKCLTFSDVPSGANRIAE